MDAATFQGVQRRFDKHVIHANGCDLHFEFFNSQLVHQILLHRLPRLRAQTAHTFFRVIAGKRGQIHARDRPQQPCRLPFLLHGSSRYLGLGAAFHCAGVHANFLHPIQVERNSRVLLERAPAKSRDRISGIRLEATSLTCHFVSCSGMVVIYWHLSFATLAATGTTP